MTRRTKLAGPALMILVATLSGCGSSDVDQLQTDSKSQNTEVQQTALRKIADLGDEGIETVPQLLEQIKSDDPEVRRLSCLALGKLTPHLEQADEQRAAIEQALTTCLTDEVANIRMTAAFAVVSMQTDNTVAQKILTDTMQSGDGGVIDRVGRMKPAPTWAVTTLTKILTTNPRPGLRRLSAVALGEIGERTPEVQAALEKGFKDTDDRVRAACDDALKKVD